MAWTTSDKVMELREKSRPFDVFAEMMDGWRRHLSGRNASLVAFFGFLSIFPLMLAAVSILGFVLSGNEKLQQDIIDGAASEIPVLGETLANNPRIGRRQRSGDRDRARDRPVLGHEGVHRVAQCTRRRLGGPRRRSHGHADLAPQGTGGARHHRRSADRQPRVGIARPEPRATGDRQCGHHRRHGGHEHRRDRRDVPIPHLVLDDLERRGDGVRCSPAPSSLFCRPSDRPSSSVRPRETAPNRSRRSTSSSGCSAGSA